MIDIAIFTFFYNAKCFLPASILGLYPNQIHLVDANLWQIGINK